MATVFKLLLTVSEQKSKFREADFGDFRVFVFSIRANSKTRKSRKDFSQFQD